ncbi:hypothetical protein M9H77_31065 [Catharanthus roseus]|uniref:Uncharacterized protein n=1 Tax=Catharanthus roseus TaxID=4058 RepID=A0ACB9ZYZ3_CATRO|nr:hypothetical protein M9H77_31065 [Catharanthus roseus]
MGKQAGEKKKRRGEEEEKEEAAASLRIRLDRTAKIRTQNGLPCLSGSVAFVFLSRPLETASFSNSRGFKFGSILFIANFLPVDSGAHQTRRTCVNSIKYGGEDIEDEGEGGVRQERMRELGPVIVENSSRILVGEFERRNDKGERERERERERQSYGDDGVGLLPFELPEIGSGAEKWGGVS